VIAKEDELRDGLGGRGREASCSLISVTVAGKIPPAGVAGALVGFYMSFRARDFVPDGEAIIWVSLWTMAGFVLGLLAGATIWWWRGRPPFCDAKEREQPWSEGIKTGRRKVAFRNKNSGAEVGATGRHDGRIGGLLLDGVDRAFWRPEPYFLRDAIQVRDPGSCVFEFDLRGPKGGLASLLDRASQEQTPIDIAPPCGWFNHNSGYSEVDMGAWTHPLEALKISVGVEDEILILKAVGSCGPIDTRTAAGYVIPEQCLKGHQFDLEIRLPLDQVEKYLSGGTHPDERPEILAAFGKLGQGNS
jgi:hypothetical protein